MDELAKRLDALVAQYGRPTIDATLAAARTEAYSNMLSAAYVGLLAIIVLLGVWMYLHYIHRRYLAAKAAAAAANNRFWDGVEYWIAGGLAISFGFVGFLILAASIWTFIDPWTWTQLNHPEVWIAKKFVLSH